MMCPTMSLTPSPTVGKGRSLRGRTALLYVDPKRLEICNSSTVVRPDFILKSQPSIFPIASSGVSEDVPNGTEMFDAHSCYL